MGIITIRPTTNQILKERMKAIRPALLAKFGDRDAVIRKALENLPEYYFNGVLKTWHLKNSDIIVIEAMEALLAENK